MKNRRTQRGLLSSKANSLWQQQGSIHFGVWKKRRWREEKKRSSFRGRRLSEFEKQQIEWNNTGNAEFTLNISILTILLGKTTSLPSNSDVLFKQGFGLDGTCWKLGTVTITTRRSGHCNVLSCLFLAFISNNGYSPWNHWRTSSNRLKITPFCTHEEHSTRSVPVSRSLGQM